MSEIEWRDPPPAKGGPPPRTRILSEQLRERPGVWARVGHAVNPSGGNVQGLRKYGCEVTVRRSGEGWDIYARWPEEK